MANIVMMYEALGKGPDYRPRAVTRRGIDKLLVIGEHEAYCQPCVSPVWDTALTCHALAEAGGEENFARMKQGLDWLKPRQVLDLKGDWAAKAPDVRPGGWAFQYNNAHYPDLDDTAVVVMAMDRARQANHARCQEGTFQNMPPVKAVAPTTRGNPNWVKGVSGNPGGRPRAIVEVVELARRETAASIAALVRVRDAEDTPPAAVVAAATALLDRAWGRPPQAITTDPANTPTMLHLIAATAVSRELVAALDERRTINSHIEPINGHADGEIVDLLMQPLPLE
jgi:hypothetical protein